MSEANFDLLDADLDELADLEGFEPIPGGTYQATINFSKREINNKPAVILDVKILEVLELADQSLDPDKYVGKSNNIAYILKKDDGNPNTVAQGQLKGVLGALQPAFGGGSPNEIMENSDGAEVGITIKIRPDKKDPDKKYNEVVAITVDTE